jgi:hypothetical protein
MRNVAITEPDPRLRTEFLKAREGQCRFIVSEGVRDAICCGAPALGASSWCAWHQQIVYQPPSTKDKKVA